jgi:hypothetical protein
MKRAFVLCVGVALMWGTSAFGAGMNLYWNDCSAGSVSTNKNFACNTNSGSQTLVASFDPPAGITRLVGSQATIAIGTASTPLASWWQLGPVGCRAGSMSLSFDFPAPQCADYWAGAANGSFAFTLETGNPERARIDVSMGVSETAAGPVEPGTEYYLFKLILDRAGTVGAGSCGGCVDPACIVLVDVQLLQPAGTPGGNPMISNPLTSNFVTWQGGAIGGAGCLCMADQSQCRDAVQDRTWGAIKSLYR